MITPSFSLTATERVLPRMALDFTTASLDSRVTFTRVGNTATVTNSSGVIAAINANLPRFDFDPTTLVCKGLLIEESRTNLLLNSLIDGTNLATQLVTTTAVAHTLTFYGTGQIVLTGTSSATVVGTGAYPSRKTLTFTPTVGTLTLTVTGTVQYAQLEAASYASSFIPTAASQVTRSADVATMTGTNFSDWFNATEGAIYAQFTPAFPSTLATGVFGPVQIDNGSTTNRIQIRISDAVGIRGLFQVAGTPTFLGGSAFVANSTNNAGLAFKNATNIMYVNASGNGTSANNVPTGLNILRIGSEGSTATTFTGIIKKISFYPQRLINNEVQAFSK